ncbi:hypothetical protein ACHAXR_001688, partial [Thalassiosira sp. AJA248-18]
KILEATAQSSSSTSADDEKTTINNVITALPGLEGFPPDHSAWSLPPQSLNEFRASNIRSAMEGKLFPNENARNRLHRKVHGMGFVEMGKVMRDMWAGIDGFTKEVFCELADVGRVGYRKRLADFKEQEGTVAVAMQPSAGSDEKKAQQSQARAKAMQQVKRIYSPKSAASRADAAVRGPVVVKIDETPKAGEKPSVLCLISPQPSQATLSGTNAPTGASNSNDRNSSSCLGLLGPLAMPPRNCAGRRVSCDTPAMGNIELQRLLQNTMAMIPAPPLFQSEVPSSNVSQSIGLNVESPAMGNNEFQHLLHNSMAMIPPPPLFQSSHVSHSIGQSNTEESGCPKIVSSSSNLSSNSNSLDSWPQTVLSSQEGEDVSTEDFLDLIGTLSKALDNGSDNTIRKPSMIFGKPIHDVHNSMHPINSIHPLPENCEMNNPRARMA